MKVYKPGTEVKVQVTYANPTRTRVKHGIVIAVQSQDRLTARVGRQSYAIDGGGKYFVDRTVYGAAALTTGAH